MTNLFRLKLKCVLLRDCFVIGIVCRVVENRLAFPRGVETLSQWSVRRTGRKDNLYKVRLGKALFNIFSYRLFHNAVLAFEEITLVSLKSFTRLRLPFVFPVDHVGK